VTSALALLERRRHDPEAVDSLRRVIERQIWHLVRLVDDLLEVSRIRTGKIQLRKERVELRKLADAAVEAAQPLVKARSQRLDVHAPERPIWLDADPTRLSQVVSNLLNNASAYTPEGGHIILTLGREAETTFFSVRDDGIGMSSETLERAFDLFARGVSAEHPATGGLGVGLALVRRLIEMHGGSVSAHSDGHGHGTQITVQLPGAQPARGPESVAPQTTTVAAAARGGPRRILVVDDNADAAEMLAALLELYGHRVGIAHDGEHALEQAKESVPEIVLLDLGLPGMDGFQVAQALRNDPSTRSARIVAVSGYGRAEDRARTERAGFDMHLVKPVDADALRTVVEAL
jgi:CheY-like chemotaxis protein